MFKFLSGCICVSKVTVSRFIFQSQRELTGLGCLNTVNLTAGQENSLFIDSTGNISLTVVPVDNSPDFFRSGIV